MKKSSTCLVDDFCCAPCGVRRRARCLAFGDFNHFNLMHPVRGVTGYVLSCLWADVISINAPRAGCDAEHFYLSQRKLSISINAPRAGCDVKGQRGIDAINIFQSMHPVRGVTAKLYNPSMSLQHVGCTILPIMCFKR